MIEKTCRVCGATFLGTIAAYIAVAIAGKGWWLNAKEYWFLWEPSGL